MKRLTQKQILMMHKQLVEQTGGSDKVLNYDLLDSALENPFQTFDGKELYPCITVTIAQNHIHNSYKLTSMPYSYMVFLVAG